MRCPAQPACRKRVGGRGFEPRLRGSKPRVLPLDQPPLLNLRDGGRGFEPRLRSPELRVLPLDQPPISNLQAGGRGFEPRLRSPELRVLPLDQPPKKKPGCLWASRSSLREKRACSLYLPDSSTCPQPFLVWVRWTCCWKKKLFMGYILGHFSIFVNLLMIRGHFYPGVKEVLGLRALLRQGDATCPSASRPV